MVGVELVTLGCTRFLGFQNDGAGLQGTVTAVAAMTLAAMIGPTVWSKGKLKLYPVLAGLAVGYLLAYSFGVFHTGAAAADARRAHDRLPRKVRAGWALDLALLPAFLIASPASTLKVLAT